MNFVFHTCIGTRSAKLIHLACVTYNVLSVTGFSLCSTMRVSLKLYNYISTSFSQVPEEVPVVLLHPVFNNGCFLELMYLFTCDKNRFALFTLS